MPALFPPHGCAPRSFGAGVLLSVAGALISCPASAQDGHAPDHQKPKATVEKPADPEAARFCANIAPSIGEARVAWETKRLAELDAQVKQRLADLEKAEASLQDWVAKRDAALKTASDDLVAVYAKMQPESAAAQIAAMDDQMAAALLSKLKPGAAGAILDQMEADRASKLAALLSATSGAEKKS
jgi:flagellar motility protein MotE (MotC chaperone)